MEIWKDIVGYEGVYRVSNMGRVESLERIIHRTDKRGYEYTYKRKGRILKNVLRSNGYYNVSLLNNSGKAKQIAVHRLVGLTFLENTLNKPQLNHIDGVKTNNSLDNLEWVDARENSIHAFKLGLTKRVQRYGKDNHRSKAVKRISKDGEIKIYESTNQAHREDGFDAGGISRCCNGQWKSHKGFKWEYI